jgi:hypothetical protein
MPTATQLILENLVFFVLTLPGLYWGWRRYADGPAFTGPRTPWPNWFKRWFKVIWFVGGVVPLLVVVVLLVQGRSQLALLAFGPYFAMFAIQIATELVCIRLRSPIWVAVPCFYLPWRLLQLERGLAVAEGQGALVLATLWLLIVLWVINIWVHYSGMPNQMRWDAGGGAGAAQRAGPSSG